MRLAARLALVFSGQGAEIARGSTGGLQLGVEDDEVVAQQAVGVEGELLEEAALVGVAHIDLALLKGAELVVERVCALEVAVAVDVERLDEPHIGLLCAGQHLVEIKV